MSDADRIVKCKHWHDGNCAHLEQPYGPKPSLGVCIKACQAYDGPDRGLGDTIARLTKVTGIKAATKAVTKITGRPCNCGKRQNALNRVVPYKTK